MEAIILAGGFGTRLVQVVKDVPKPMATVAGKPFLVYVVEDLVSQGVNRIVMAVCYKKECIMNYFGNSYKGTEILYSVEEKPLFTGGAIKLALSLCHERRVFIVNGDTFFSVNLQKMRSFAEEKKKSTVIAIKEMMSFDRYGKIEVSESGLVTAFKEKAPCKKGWINGGIYDIKSNCLQDFPTKFSVEQECFPKLLEMGEIVALPSEVSSDICHS
jgi:D-glycero-alpha-D-manno-heptose 1-phosphate guanylyltransferase